MVVGTAADHRHREDTKLQGRVRAVLSCLILPPCTCVGASALCLCKLSAPVWGHKACHKVEPWATVFPWVWHCAPATAGMELPASSIWQGRRKLWPSNFSAQPPELQHEMNVQRYVFTLICPIRTPANIRLYALPCPQLQQSLSFPSVFVSLHKIKGNWLQGISSQKFLIKQ